MMVVELIESQIRLPLGLVHNASAYIAKLSDNASYLKREGRIYGVPGASNEGV